MIFYSDGILLFKEYMFWVSEVSYTGRKKKSDHLMPGSLHPLLP